MRFIIIKILNWLDGTFIEEKPPILFVTAHLFKRMEFELSVYWWKWLHIAHKYDHTNRSTFPQVNLSVLGEQFSRVASHCLKWENKTYNLKASVKLVAQGCSELLFCLKVWLLLAVDSPTVRCRIRHAHCTASISWRINSIQCKLR